ncbi:hypothetical protein M8J77_018082 [Diaphorina citri]|nr:hypothetical protein M8J77_018082 [Diaphorina citri]
MGDFNAKIRKHKDGDAVVGKFGVGERNDRGQRLIQFSEETRLKIMNTFFKKQTQRKWTWRSPNHEIRNEIDFILANKMETIKDVTVLNRFNTGSDHRLVRAKLAIDLRQERRKLIRKKIEIIDEDRLLTKQEEFQSCLKENLENASPENIGAVIMSTAKEVGGTTSKKRKNKITEETKSLLERRRQMKIDNNTNKIEYSELCKTIRRKMKDDIERFNIETVKRAIEEKKSFKKAKQKLMIGKNQLIALDGPNGRINDGEEILEHIRSFYKELYAKTNDEEQLTQETRSMNEEEEKIPEILPDEVTNAINLMKKDKATGDDEVSINILKLTGEETAITLAKIFTNCLINCKIPSSWNTAKIIILHKKGSIFDIKNYRPICLLSCIYKLLTKILTIRLTNTLDFAQPIEQAGFRSDFSTIDHIHSLREIISRAHEYEMPLCISFVDFEKAFDSVKYSAVFEALKEQGIHKTYIKLLEYIYLNSSAYVFVNKPTKEFPIKRGVKQGDPISPKLFSAVLEMAMSKIPWNDRGIKINGRRLNNLRFADDIVLLATNTLELQSLTQDLAIAAKEIGLKMNISKTKIMYNEWCTAGYVSVDNKNLEQVEEYVYLGQLINLKGDFKPEIFRRINLGWRAYWKNAMVFKSNMPLELKKQVFDQCVLPVLTYGSETWTLTEYIKGKLRTAQRAMERSMLGVKKQDRIRATTIRENVRY